jgi:hypothetical protein
MREATRIDPIESTIVGDTAGYYVILDRIQHYAVCSAQASSENQTTRPRLAWRGMGKLVDDVFDIRALYLETTSISNVTIALSLLNRN